jgi:hypothetical protein
MALEKLRAGSVVQQHLACATVPSMHTTRYMPRPCQHGAWMPACPWTAKSSQVSVPEPWGPPRCRADSHFFFQFRASLTARGPYVSGSSFLYLRVGPTCDALALCDSNADARFTALGFLPASVPHSGWPEITGSAERGLTLFVRTEKAPAFVLTSCARKIMTGAHPPKNGTFHALHDGICPSANRPSLLPSRPVLELITLWVHQDRRGHEHQPEQNVHTQLP